MEHSKNNVKILIIVEGERTEKAFFYSLLEKFRVNGELYLIKNNLYSIYNKMKKYGFDCDVKDVLAELSPSDKDLLNEKFTYTYLVFDSDLQHHGSNEVELSNNLDFLTKNNFTKLQEMAKYFTDETDPSIGRLYINYPMMESYRYCNSFSDSEYLYAVIPITEMKSFKELAGKKALSGKNISLYTKENFTDLIKQNIKKLFLLSKNDYQMYPQYNTYLKISDSLHISNIQLELITAIRALSVLNTSLFLIVDYYGNRDSFFDKLFDLS